MVWLVEERTGVSFDTDSIGIETTALGFNGFKSLITFIHVFLPIMLCSKNSTTIFAFKTNSFGMVLFNMDS